MVSKFEIFCGTGGYRRLLRLLEMSTIKKVVRDVLGRVYLLEPFAEG